MKKDILLKEEEKEIQEIREFDFEKEIDFEKYEREFDWIYRNNLSTKLPIKSTVIKIKEMQNDGVDYFELGKKEIGIAEIVPSFMENEERVSASRRGTLMHLFLQKLDLKRTYSKEELEDLKQELIAKKMISEEESDFINIFKIQNFLNSKLAEKIKQALIIEKEKAFCIKIKAKEVFEEANDESILVQGIIDLYAVFEDGKILLLDYKTDYVELGNEEMLIKKYKNQLKIYKQALEEALDKKVEDVYIYSLYLNKEIKICD